LVEPDIQLGYCPDVEEKQGNQNFEQQDLIWKINKVENFVSKGSLYSFVLFFFFWVSLAFLIENTIFLVIGPELTNSFVATTKESQITYFWGGF
jgi:hypothetical protein